MVSYAGNAWARYSGLLVVGFGLGPTVPNVMTWTKYVIHIRDASEPLLTNIVKSSKEDTVKLVSQLQQLLSPDWATWVPSLQYVTRP